MVWLAMLAGWMAVHSLELGRDPAEIVSYAEAFDLRALDVSGRRYPIATFDGLRWLAASPRALVGPPAGEPPAIVGLETTDGVPVTTLRVFAVSGEAWAWARRTIESLAVRAAHLGDRRLTEVSMYVPAGAGGYPVFVDMVVRTPEPSFRGAVVGGWVLAVDGGEPVVLGARTTTFASYDALVAAPRRHPLGVAVAGRGGDQTWVMYRRDVKGDAFELAGVGRRGIVEHPPIPRGPS
ncbi:MAG: hypothetical protein R2745_18125 [Vicinamibacterales bacterium]